MFVIYIKYSILNIFLIILNIDSIVGYIILSYIILCYTRYYLYLIIYLYNSNNYISKFKIIICNT